MSEAVLADAQFGTTRVLRPIIGFEDTYEGESAARPIYCFEGNEHLDKLAADGVPGYDPTLARGLSMPLGARVVLWVPSLFWEDQGDPPTVMGYEWIVIWRLRNVADFRRARIPYHLPKQGAGPNDTTAPPGTQARVVIPAAYNTITYIQAEPALQLARAVQHVHAEDLEFSQTPVVGPLLPDGTEQAVEQGILDPALIVDANRPQFMLHDLTALGDEMLLAVRRDSSTIVTWDFATTDLRFSQFLGNGTGQQFPDVGVYVSVGSAP